MLPQIAQGEANKVWVIPSEFTSAMEQLKDAFGDREQKGTPPPPPPAVPPPRS
jgi:hypothetical protein